MYRGHGRHRGTVQTVEREREPAQLERIESFACDPFKRTTMGKKGKKTQAGKPKRLTPKDVGKRLDILVKKLEEELKGADLFAPLPPTEDCAICLVPLPLVQSERRYSACCGNEICKACYIENRESINKQNEEKNPGKKVALTCPFCREPVPTTYLELLHQLQARCPQNSRNTLTATGELYQDGQYGSARDDLKALDCFIRAVELGSPSACFKIGKSYHDGKGVAVNKERAALFERIGALRGDIDARHNIGHTELYGLGNHEVAIRHWKIAAEAGYQLSLDALKKIYIANSERPGKKIISKECMDSLYRVCHEAQGVVKSEAREKAELDMTFSFESTSKDVMDAMRHLRL